MQRTFVFNSHVLPDGNLACPQKRPTIYKDAQNRLLKDSLLKTTQINSFDTRRFIKYIRRINDDIMGSIDINIHKLFFGTKY